MENFSLSIFRSFGDEEVTVQDAMAKAGALKAVALKRDGGETVEEPAMHLIMELNRDKKYVFPENVAEFLNTWLIDHIMVVDRELGKFLKKSGVK